MDLYLTQIILEGHILSCSIHRGTKLVSDQLRAKRNKHDIFLIRSEVFNIRFRHLHVNDSGKQLSSSWAITQNIICSAKGPI